MKYFAYLRDAKDIDTTNYLYMLEPESFAIGVKMDTYAIIHQILRAEDPTSIHITGLNHMISEIQKKMSKFCSKYPNIHSSWIYIDHSRKKIILYIVTDKLDFDLEYKIFQGPYGDLPVDIKGYYIDRRVTNLDKNAIGEEILPEFKKIYSRKE